MKIPDFEAEALAAVRAAGTDIGRIFGHRHASAETAAATATIEPSTTGGPVPLSQELHDIFAKAEAGAARVEALGEGVAEDIEAINADPEFAPLLATVRNLIKLSPAAGIVSLVAAPLTELEARLLAAKQQREQQEQQSAPSFTPAGVRVAGQA